MANGGNPNWVSGQSGNPNGRPLGTRDKKYRKYQEAAEQEGLEDPVLFQHRKLKDESIDIAVRASIASNISPYYYPKWGTTSPPPAPVFIATPIDLQPPTSIEQAKANIATLITSLAKGEIDHASYDRLIAGNAAMINALLGQDKLLVAQGDTGHDTTIRIEGGLPALPGTNITMPNLTNGHDSFQLLDHQTQNPSSIDGVHTDTTTESTPTAPFGAVASTTTDGTV